MKQKLHSAWLTLRNYWDKPRHNEYVNYKELACFCLGGMGVKTVNAMLNYLQLSTQCLLISQVYGLSPKNIMVLFIITNVINVIKTPFVSKLVDSTHTAIGKFRPYLIWAGIPSVIAVCGLAWMPLFDSMLLRVIWIGVMFNLLSLFQPLYNNAYMGVSQVITPNSGERTRIMSISEFLANLGPSLVQLLLPTIAGIVLQDKNSLTNLMTYRIFLPIFGLSGFFVGLLVMYRTKERVLLTDQEQRSIGFIEGIRRLSHNRNFWIVTISKFFDGFKAVVGMLLTWVVSYQLNQSSSLGLIQTIVNVAFTPGMLLAPLLMYKMGPKAAGFFAHILNALAAAVMLFVYDKGIVLFAIAQFVWNFACGPQYVMQTSILSDGLDWQQDKEGVRIEGFAQNFMLMITTIGTIVSTVIFTYIYEYFGLVADESGQMNYEEIFAANPQMLNDIIFWVMVVVLIASALSALPYLFCKLGNKDMEAIRQRLEKKKYLHANGLENADPEQQDEANAAYTAEIANQHAKEKEELALAKQQAAEKYRAQQEDKREQDARLIEQMQEEIASGVSEREAKKHYRAAIEQIRLAQSAQRKQASLIRSRERQEYLARKRAFIRKDKAERIARGERRYAGILAREAFDEIIRTENQNKYEQEISTDLTTE